VTPSYVAKLQIKILNRAPEMSRKFNESTLILKEESSVDTSCHNLMKFTGKTSMHNEAHASVLRPKKRGKKEKKKIHQK